MLNYMIACIKEDAVFCIAKTTAFLQPPSDLLIICRGKCNVDRVNALAKKLPSYTEALVIN